MYECTPPCDKLCDRIHGEDPHRFSQIIKMKVLTAAFVLDLELAIDPPPPPGGVLSTMIF